MFRASQHLKVNGVKYEKTEVRTQYRLSIVYDAGENISIRGRYYYDRCCAASAQCKFYVGNGYKTLINPVVSIEPERVYPHAENYDENNNDGIADVLIVRSYHYRGFRIDINNRGAICILRPDDNGNLYNWKMIRGNILANYKRRLSKALDYIDLTLFNEHKDWQRLYVCYAYINDDRHYRGAYTTYEAAVKNKRSDTFIEEIEVPFVNNNILYYIEWFRDVNNMYIVESKRYEETSDLYSSITLASKDDIWKKMQFVVRSIDPSIDVESSTHNYIATSVNGRPFTYKDIRKEYGARADIKILVVLDD